MQHRTIKFSVLTIVILSMLFLNYNSLYLQNSKVEEFSLEARDSINECMDNTSTGDCDNDSLSNLNEDRDGDGNWSNDDSDADGIPNYLDEDDDNDGWPTWMECPLSSGQNHEDCPGFGGVKDYLHENLYNCDQPFVHLAYATNPYQFKLFIYIEHNSSLIELLYLNAEGGANSDRSHLDGRIHWVNASPINEHRFHHSWIPDSFIDEGSINTSNGFMRMDFNIEGEMVAQHNNSLVIINPDNNNWTIIGEFNQSTGGGGDLIVDSNNDIFLFGYRGEIFHVPNGSLDATLIGNISHIDGFNVSTQIKGLIALENGSLMYNSGENIYLVEGDWNSGFNDTGHNPNGDKLQIYHLHSSADSTTGGDMANCQIPNQDQDFDNIPDYYEERVFLTNITNPDTDLDGLLDGEEILIYGTDPLSNDTDGDGCGDGDEINNYSTSPFIQDSDGNGVIDCLVQTTLDYQGPEFIFWDEVNTMWSPIISGHQPEVWNISPNPPSWLNFSQGVFSGNPTSQYYNQTFIVTCNGNGGQAQTSVNIEVKVPPPLIDYQTEPDYSLGELIELNATSLRGPITSWQLSNQLPQGLNFSEGNFFGYVEEPGHYNFTITANGATTNDGGTDASDFYSITIVIEDFPPNEIMDDEDNEGDNEGDDENKPTPKFDLIWVFLWIIIIVAVILLLTYFLTREKEEVSEEEKTDAGLFIDEKTNLFDK